MPNRVLRESILDSEAVNSLSAEAEVFYRRLMSVVDDFGRFDARIPVLRSRLYPLQLEKVREANVERCLAECEAARLVRLYVAGGKQYLTFPKLGEPRAKESKFPPPPDELPEGGALNGEQTRADENTCAHVRPNTDSSAPTNSSSTSSPNSRKRFSAREGDAMPLPLTPESLAQQFAMRYTGTASAHRNTFRLGDEFREWIAKLRITPASILAELERSERDTSEPPWELKKRLAPAKATEKKRESMRYDPVRDAGK